MKLVTSLQMRELDSLAIGKHRIASLTLMERAGAGIAAAVERLVKPDRGQVAVIAGRGNNGGDGLVAARLLIGRGWNVFVILLASPNDLSPDARANFELLAPLTTHLYTVADNSTLAMHMPAISSASCIIDAIIGTGLDRDVTGLNFAAIASINSTNAPVISADIPSGLSADTGRALGIAARARVTTTFGLPKIGLFIGDGPDFAGRVEVIDIGIPKEEADRVESSIELIDPSNFKQHFGRRDPSSHKGTYGHVAVFAGSLGHLGAGYLSCLAALRSGAGLATYCLPEKAFVRFDARYAEIMCDPIPDTGTAKFDLAGIDHALRLCDGKSVVVLGPAIGTDKATKEFVNAFVAKLKIPLIIDADGLNVLDLSSIKTRRAATILTPHPGEMARLVGASVKEVQSDRLNIARKLAKSCNATVILKGRGTIVASPDGTAAINPTGNAGMATAGMGDALTGVIASFLAQGMDVESAGSAAVYIHGLAGEMAASEVGERALITSDVIRSLGHAIKKVSP